MPPVSFTDNVYQKMLPYGMQNQDAASTKLR